MAVTIYPLTKMLGVTGTAISVALGVSVTTPFWWHVSSGIIRSSYKETVVNLAPSLIGTGIIGLCIILARRAVDKIGFQEFDQY